MLNLLNVKYFLYRCLPFCVQSEEKLENAKAETDSIKK